VLLPGMAEKIKFGAFPSVKRNDEKRTAELNYTKNYLNCL
jgi:hypothetical protein